MSGGREELIEPIGRPASGVVLSIDDVAQFSGAGHAVASRVFTRDGVGNVISSKMASELPESAWVSFRS